MKSLIRLGRKTLVPRKGIIALFYFLISAGALVAQPITVVIQTPDGAREVCQGPGTFVLTAFAEGGNQNFVDYQWTSLPGMLNPQGDYAIFNNAFSILPGEYLVSVTVFDNEGNSGSASIIITLKETPTVSITADGPTTFCFGESVDLIADPDDGFMYNWRKGIADIPGEIDYIYAATESGNYRVRITGENGCFSLSNVIGVNVLELPDVSASNSGPVCEGSDLQLIGGPDGMVTYYWGSLQHTEFNSSEQSPIISSITASQAGEYFLIATGDNGCDNSIATIVVVYEAPIAPVSASASQTNICSGAEGSISLTATGGSGQILRWFTGGCGITPIGQGNNLEIPFPETTTTYYVLWETDCGQSDCVSVTVTVTDPPEISITSTPISCNGDNDATATVSITGGTPPYSILWSNGATTPAIENLGPGTYSVTVTDAAGCIVSEDVTIIEPENIVLSFIDVTNPVCHGEDNGQATVVVGGGTPPFSYLWSNGQTTPTATGLAAETYQVIVTDDAGCVETANVTLTNPPQIVISIVSITHVECHGESTGAVTVGASNGTEPYTYEWDNGQTGPSLVNLPAATYVVSVTDANGCQAILSIEIYEPEPLEVNAGPDQTICAGETATLTATGGDTYLWNTGETTASIVVAPLVTTTYTVTGFSECGQETDEVTVFVFEAPVVDLGDDVEICDGEEVTLDAGTLPNVSYLWSTGAATQTITVTAGGNYWVTVTNLVNGCSSTDIVAVILNPLPPADTGPDQTICLGEAIILGPTDPVPSPTSTFLWTSVPADPSLTQPTISNPTVSPTVTTVYTLLETFLDTGCENENSVTITVVGEAPDAGEDQTICQGESVTLGPETINPGSTYYWTSSNPDEVFDDQVSNPVVSPQGTTTYTIFEVAGECTFSDTVTITVNPLPEADAGTDKEICFGESVMIGPDDFTPSPTSTFLWSSVPNDSSISDPTISNPIVSPQVTTVYTLVETFIETGCSNQNSITVTVHELPEIQIADDAVICEGETVNLGHPEASQEYTYSWTSDPAGFVSSESNPTVSPSVTTTYFVTVSTAFGCEATGQVTISVNPAPVPNVSVDIVFCSEEEIEPVYIGGEAIEGYIYEWTSEPSGFFSNEANPLVTLPDGTNSVLYILNVTNEYDCSAIFAVRISLSDLQLTVEDPSICEDEETLSLGNFVIVTGGTPPYSYRWLDSQGNLLDQTLDFIAVAPFLSAYMVEVTDAEGCMQMETINVTILPTPVVLLVAEPSGTAYVGQTITFTAMPGNFPHYEFFVNGVSVQAGSSNIYRSSQLQNGQVVTVAATSVDGCTGFSDPYTVLISGLPNAFTPGDGDGINDIFGKDYDLVIFNRWGQAVYEGNEGWDGKHNGKDVSPGTYYYIMEIFDHNNNKTVLKGSITVIRHR